MAEARRWLDLPHMTEDVVIEQIRVVMGRKGCEPPHSLSYFTDEMQRLSGDLVAAATKLGPVNRAKRNSASVVPMPARPTEIDLDALAKLWVPNLIGGRPVPASAISAALARHMREKGLVEDAHLRRAGVTW